MDGLGKTETDDQEIPISRVLTILDFVDTLPCLRTVENHDREKMLLSVWYARQVQHRKTSYFQDNSVLIKAINVAEKFAQGNATKDELIHEQDLIRSLEPNHLVNIDRRLLELANYVLQGDVEQVWRLVYMLMPMRTTNVLETEFRRMINCLKEGQQYH